MIGIPPRTLQRESMIRKFYILAALAAPCCASGERIDAAVNVATTVDPATLQLLLPVPLGGL